MHYIKVNWIQSGHDEPVLLYSELDHERWETRKVEVFADGTMGFAGSADSSESITTRLSEVPLPTNDMIAADPQFQPVEISAEEFEAVWSQRHHP